MLKVLQFYAILFGGLILSVPLCCAQKPASEDLEMILQDAEKQAGQYQKGFKDLIAKEIKTFENFKPTGELIRRKTVESNFLVYESKRDERAVSEFRNVTTVDGKLVSKKARTSAEVFEEARRSKSVEKELEKIQRRSSKYDDTLEISGSTLFQALTLSTTLRPFFNFEVMSKELFRGTEVYVVSYSQTKETPLITGNPENLNSNALTMVYDLPKSLRQFQIRLSGKLWIDAKTFQLWREDRNLTVLTENPFRLMKTEFEYVPSNYGFLVPKKIQLTQYRFDPKNQVEGQIQTQVKFDYSEFTKTKVEVEMLDDEEPVETKPQ
jgi:hypothetical protein